MAGSQPIIEEISEEISQAERLNVFRGVDQ
jgi:hypothetical protein